MERFGESFLTGAGFLICSSVTARRARLNMLPMGPMRTGRFSAGGLEDSFSAGGLEEGLGDGLRCSVPPDRSWLARGGDLSSLLSWPLRAELDK